MSITKTGRLPINVPTTTMKISNYTDQTLWLVGSDNPYGCWVVGPREFLSPGTTQLVTAVANIATPALQIAISYDIGETGNVVNFVSTNDSLGARLVGSGVVGRNSGDYEVTYSTNAGVPNVFVGYALEEAW